MAHDLTPRRTPGAMSRAMRRHHAEAMEQVTGGKMVKEKPQSIRRCRNCADNVHTPDERTGLIHTHGRYSCNRLYGTFVAE